MFGVTIRLRYTDQRGQDSLAEVLKAVADVCFRTRPEFIQFVLHHGGVNVLTDSKQLFDWLTENKSHLEKM